jgi:predicted nucleic acid-binding protein
MSDEFLDSNVLIYSFDRDFSTKRRIAQGILTEALSSDNIVISFQVVQETLNTLQRKFKKTVTSEDARELLTRTLVPLMRVMPSPALYSEALRISARYQYSFFDSLIIASALSAQCLRLLSEDLQHGQNIEGLEIINPFL